MLKQQKKTAWSVLATAAAAAVGGMIASSPAAHGAIRINEIMLDAPGTNSTQDFIELISTTGGVESVDGLTMLMIEGETGAAAGSGSIDHIVSFSGGSTGTNGLFLRHSFTTGPLPAPAPETFQQSGGWGHENLAITYLLVTGFTGNVGDDLDTDNDGTLETTPWTSVVDAVGFLDGNVATDRVYGTKYGGADFNQNALGGGATDPAAVFRDANGAWHGARIAGPVGGPYVVDAGLTAENGYTLSPGNVNNATAVPARAWVGAAGGAWNAPANWTGGAAPGAAGEVAMFDGGGANTLNLTADATVGILSFNGGSHTIAAGGGTLTLDTVSGNAQILSQYGDPSIAAPVLLQKDTNMRVGRGTTLTLANLNANGKLITKQGIGHLAIGSTLVTSGFTVTSGSVQLASDGSASRVLVAPALTLSGTTSRIDITDNKVITNNPAGTQTGGIYSDVQGMVQKGRAGGAWTGQGITLITSLPTNNDLTSIGVATGAQIDAVLAGDPLATALFAGQTITGASTIAMYTYGGDANLDGFVSGDDYTAIDFAISTPGADGWVNGDFNYDGFISGDDYTIIDFNIVAQGAPFPTSGSGAAGTTAVPEPAVGGVALLAGMGLLGRRRQRQSR